MTLDALNVAVGSWVSDARPVLLTRWLERELDPEGVPRRLPTSVWLEGLQVLARAWTERSEGWPDRFDAVAEGWFRALLRFSRPDGSSAMDGSPPGDAVRRQVFRSWARRLSDPGLMTVVDWWMPGSAPTHHAPPPLPADARPDRPLAVLRANWQKDGDFLAVDHRHVGPASAFELFALGRPWLGPWWTSGEPGATAAAARNVRWLSHSSADLFEWSLRIGSNRITRTAVLLRGRKLALLGEQWEGPAEPGAMWFGLADGIDAEPIDGQAGLRLVPQRGRASARLLPIGQARGGSNEKGTLTAVPGAVLLSPPAQPARRGWRPLLATWDPARDRRPIQWRTLTVTENMKVCGPDVAFAARVSWGVDQTLLIYRSLTPPAPRAVLGHQTRAALLIALFTREGEVEPLLKVEDE